MPNIWVEVSETSTPGSSEGYGPAYKQFDWPVVPRIGELIFIRTFNEELKVQNVIHSFSEGKIVICFEVPISEFEVGVRDGEGWLDETEFAKA